MQRVKDMMADLNAMLAADARGEHTQEQFDEFMEKYGDMFPDNPANLEELVDSLARRAAAAERMMRSMSAAAARRSWPTLMAGALEDMDLAREMAQLDEALRARRPDLDWRSRERMRGDEPLGAGDGDQRAAGPRRPRRARVDPRPGLPRRQPRGRRRGGGPARARPAARSTTCASCAGWSASSRSRATSTAAATGSTSPPRRSAGSARPRCGTCSPTCARRGRGGHDVHDAGQAGELTGASRPVAVRRRAAARRRTHPHQRGAGRPGRARDGTGRGIAPVDRGLRGRRDRPAYVGRGLPARRPVLLDGAARHLGRGEGDRAGAARAGVAGSSRRTR